MAARSAVDTRGQRPDAREPGGARTSSFRPTTSGSWTTSSSNSTRGSSPALQAMGSESRRPVFIFGLPRSGTSLIEQVLASHSRVHGAGELRLGRQSFEAIPQVTGRNAHPMECIANLDAESIRRLAELHLERLKALAPERAERVIDKMPDNYMYVGLLATLFPQAAFIHCRRDLRDVALSCWMTDFRSMSWPFDTSTSPRGSSNIAG